MTKPTLAAALGVFTLVGPVASAPAQAATTIGSDLSAAAIPIAGCVEASCTAVGMEQATAGAPHDLIAPSDGVIVRFRIKHDDVSAPNAFYSFKVVSGAGGVTGDPPTASFTFVRGTGEFRFNPAAGIDTATLTDASGRPVGLPISSLQRVAVSVRDDTPAFETDDVSFQAFRIGYSLGERAGDHTSGSAEYDHYPGYELLVNADIEPDADRDGYGDETQDACASSPGPGACPPAAKPVPADWVRPRVGRLVRVRRPLSSLSSRGLSIPFACYGPCSAQGALVMSNIAGAVLRRHGYNAKSAVVGRGSKRTTRGGKAKLKVTLSRRGRKLLRAVVRRKAKLALRTTASDRWGKSSRKQKIVVIR